MGGDSDKIDKIRRNYRKLQEAILLEEPLGVILMIQQKCEELMGNSIDLWKVIEDCKKYAIHPQGGHLMLLPKSSLVYQKLEAEVRVKGAHAQEMQDYLHKSSNYPDLSKETEKSELINFLNKLRSGKTKRKLIDIATDGDFD